MNRVSQAIYGIKGMIKSDIHQKVAAELMDYGAELIRKAIATKMYQNRTCNLVSSYGIGLFVDGREWKGPFIDTPAMSGLYHEMDYPGRLYSTSGTSSTMVDRVDPSDGFSGKAYDYLDRFFDEYKAPKGKWQLVLVAAMFYGSAVEAKGYDVISQVAVEMASSQVAQKYKGIVKPVPNIWNGQI